jgi:NAD(P)-dependent dehydrogenase (short-subunit alcohol dehydrogenase family)
MLPIDLSGKRAFVAGVADDGGFGFAIAKALAMAGASVCVGTWPPALGVFEALLRRGKLDASLAMPAKTRRRSFASRSDIAIGATSPSRGSPVSSVRTSVIRASISWCTALPTDPRSRGRCCKPAEADI